VIIAIVQKKRCASGSPLAHFLVLLGPYVQGVHLFCVCSSMTPLHNVQTLSIMYWCLFSTVHVYELTC